MAKRFEISVKIDDNSEILEQLDKVLAGVFNGSFSTSRKITRALLRMLSTNEMPGPYKIIWNVIESLYARQGKFICKDTFDRQLFVYVLDQGINTVIRKHKYAFEDWIKRRNLQFDLKSVRGVKSFADFMYQLTLNKYDDIMQWSPDLAESYLQPLCEDLKKNALERGLVEISKVLSVGVDTKYGVMHGTEDALELMQVYGARIGQKYVLDDMLEQRYKMYCIDSIESDRKFKAETKFISSTGKEVFTPLYDMGLGPLELTILVSDIVAIIGDEGVGKTKMLVDQVYRALRAGINALVVCTETAVSVMRTMILARHIYEQSKFQISETEIKQFEDMIDKKGGVRKCV